VVSCLYVINYVFNKVNAGIILMFMFYLSVFFWLFCWAGQVFAANNTADPEYSFVEKTIAEIRSGVKCLQEPEFYVQCQHYAIEGVFDEKVGSGLPLVPYYLKDNQFWYDEIYRYSGKFDKKIEHLLAEKNINLSELKDKDLCSFVLSEAQNIFPKQALFVGADNKSNSATFNIKKMNIEKCVAADDNITYPYFTISANGSHDIMFVAALNKHTQETSWSGKIFRADIDRDYSALQDVKFKNIPVLKGYSTPDIYAFEFPDLNSSELKPYRYEREMDEETLAGKHLLVVLKSRKFKASLEYNEGDYCPSEIGNYNMPYWEAVFVVKNNHWKYIYDKFYPFGPPFGGPPLEAITFTDLNKDGRYDLLLQSDDKGGRVVLMSTKDGFERFLGHTNFLTPCEDCP